MKKKYIFMALAGMAAMFTSCSDELISEHKGVEKHTGDEILFGGRAGFEANEIGGNGDQAKTRTIYTGKTYTFNGKKYEGIQWQADDKVRIYCPQANNYKTSDYTVNTTATGVTDGKDSITGLTRINPDGALQWGDPEKPHDFYAVYPAPQQHLGENNSDADVLNNDTIFVGVIPGIQYRKGDFATESYKWDDGKNGGTGTRYIAKPNMDYAYMVAKTSVKKPNEFGNNIYLHFLPIVTAVEITVSNLATNSSYHNGQDLSLANVLVGCNDGEIVYGGFQANVAQIADNLGADGKEGEDGYGDEFYGTVTAITENTKISSGSQISIPMYQGTNGLYGDPLVLHHGDAVTFTVFMLPNADHDNLRITLQGIGGTKSAVINGAKITAKKKNYIRNLPLAGENILPFTQAEWLKYIEDEVIVENLSIPVAGGAASGVKNSNNEYVLDATSRQQSASLKGLWEYGIRGFEFAVDYNKTEGATSLDDQPILCNGLECGNMDITTAVDSVIQLIYDHPNEFGIVIISYQNTGGWGDRNPAKFMSQLNKFWEGVETRATAKGVIPALYNQTKKMKDMRKSLFCIARPTSIYQDYGTNVVQQDGTSGWFHVKAKFKTTASVNYPTIEDPRSSILVIRGWGPLKDKWQQRGFTGLSYRGTTTTQTDSKPGRPFDVATQHYAAALGIGLYYSWEGNNNFDLSNYVIPSTLKPNFYYDTQVGSEVKTSAAYVQEWARVSDWQKEYVTGEIETTGGSCAAYNKCKKEKRGFYWASSLAEKENHVINTLDSALADKEHNYLWINSLCGYFIDTAIDDSYYPCTMTDYNANSSDAKQLSASSAVSGLRGNIGRFATHMNKFFSEYLQSETNGYVPGSMGIIMMDRVGDDEYSKNIPSYIVSNNFQHDTGAQAVALSMPRSDYDQQNDGTPAAKTRSNESKGGFTVTWE